MIFSPKTIVIKSYPITFYMAVKSGQ